MLTSHKQPRTGLPTQGRGGRGNLPAGRGRGGALIGSEINRGRGMGNIDNISQYHPSANYPPPINPGGIQTTVHIPPINLKDQVYQGIIIWCTTTLNSILTNTIHRSRDTLIITCIGVQTCICPTQCKVSIPQINRIHMPYPQLVRVYMAISLPW